MRGRRRAAAGLGRDVSDDQSDRRRRSGRSRYRCAMRLRLRSATSRWPSKRLTHGRLTVLSRGKLPVRTSFSPLVLPRSNAKLTHYLAKSYQGGFADADGMVALYDREQRGARRVLEANSERANVSQHQTGNCDAQPWRSCVLAADTAASEHVPDEEDGPGYPRPFHEMPTHKSWFGGRRDRRPKGE
jgi:hypothetical protein